MQSSTFSYHAATGWSVRPFPQLDSKQSLIVVFFAPEYVRHQEALFELFDAYPKSQIIGCSTSGEIDGAFVSDASISVAVMKMERTKVKLSAIEVKDKTESNEVGMELARTLDKDNLCGAFVMSDGLSVNGSALVNGLNAVLPSNIPITGGLAGDGDRFQNTWVIRDRQLQSGVVVAAGFYGNKLRITHGSGGGWDNFGPERRITRAKGNILYELDEKPALELYKTYLGELASDLPAMGLRFPLSIRQDNGNTHHLVRTIRAVNENDQSITLAGDVPTGYLAQLMRANFDRLVGGAADAAVQAAENICSSDSPVSIAISCVGRRLVLGERTEEETEVILEHMPAQTQQIGFYSYGEISPFANGSCDLHNQTMTITTFSEA